MMPTDNKPNEIYDGSSSLISLPFKPPSATSRTNIYAAAKARGQHDLVEYSEEEDSKSIKRRSFQPIILVEDYLPVNKSRKVTGSSELRTRISITDFKKQIKENHKMGRIPRYKPRDRNNNHDNTKNIISKGGERSKLLQSFVINKDKKKEKEDEEEGYFDFETSLDHIVEKLDPCDVGDISREEITRCVICDRILYELLPCEGIDDNAHDCVCSNCIKPYNSMIETINRYEYIPSTSSSHSDLNHNSKDFSLELRQMLRNMLK